MKVYFFIIFNVFWGILQAQRANLGSVINDSKRTDSYIIFSPDGNTMYFSRKNPGTHFDIYYSTKINDKNAWSVPQPLTELNNEKPNMIFYIYPDGNKMLINGAYGEKGICMVTKENGKWVRPTPLRFEPKVSQWEQHNAKLSKDGKVMILSYQYDICVSFLQPNGSWTYPKKLPQNINTPYYEYTPFLAPDDKTLFFSSGGHGAAQNDIFVTTRLDDTWLNWSEPINCGSIVNSVDWESHFTIPNSSDLCYFYSLSEGNGDIFTVPLKSVYMGNPMTSLSGLVLDKQTNQPIAAELEFIHNQEFYKTKSDDNGNYNLWLPAGKDYIVNIQSDNYPSKNENLELSNTLQFANTTKNFYLEKDKSIIEQSDYTDKITIVYFDFDKDNPKQTSIEELKNAVDLVKKEDVTTINIEGHTDSIGSDEYNMGLSIRRAISVYKFFKQMGIQEAKMKYQGFGETKPVDTNATEEGRAKNRRVEIFLKKRK